MPAKKKPRRLPGDVRRKIDELLPLVRTKPIARIIWRRLPPPERSRVKKSPDIGPDILDIWRKLRGSSIQRSVLDMAELAGILVAADHKHLRGQIGEPLEGFKPDDPRPFWDSDRGQLWFQEQRVRQLRGSQVASRVRLILDAFQAQGWPGRIGDPLPSPGDPERLRDSIRSLNAGIKPKALRFKSDGNGKGVIWSPA